MLFITFFPFLLHTLRGGRNCSFEIWNECRRSFLLIFHFCFVVYCSLEHRKHLNTILVHTHPNESSLLLSSYVCFSSFIIFDCVLCLYIPYIPNDKKYFISWLDVNDGSFLSQSSSVVTKCIIIFCSHHHSLFSCFFRLVV